MTGSELRDRVRREEVSARGEAVRWSLQLVGVLVTIGLVWRYGPELLAQVLPLDDDVLRQLTLFPIGFCLVGVLMCSVEAVTGTRTWLAARAIRRRVDRAPDRAALLVPPLAGHLASLKKVAGHRRATVHKLLWFAVPAALVVAVLISGVTVTQEGGGRRAAPEMVPGVLAFFGIIALLLAVPVILRWRRWRTAATVRRWSQDPSRGARLDELGSDAAPAPADAIPPVQVRFVDPPRTGLQPWLVSGTRNVAGAPPIQLAYLRLFDNQARVRDFLRGAWREFGYVFLLRSADSVTPAELRAAQRGGTDLLVTTPRQFRAELDRQPTTPLPPGRHKLVAISDLPVKVLDPAGSYPVRSVLCHGSFWQIAVDLLLARVEVVVLDLSGYRPANAGTQFELQRVIDRFPIERAVLLCEPDSDRTFLEAQLRYHWARMAAGSPNAGGSQRRITVAAVGPDRLATRWLLTQATG